MKLDRLLAITLQLMAKKRVTASKLATRFEVFYPYDIPGDRADQSSGHSHRIDETTFLRTRSYSHLHASPKHRVSRRREIYHPYP